MCAEKMTIRKLTSFKLMFTRKSSVLEVIILYLLGMELG